MRGFSHRQCSWSSVPALLVAAANFSVCPSVGRARTRAHPDLGHTVHRSGRRGAIVTAVHRVAVLVFDGVKLLDVAGPSEVFAEANRGGANYELVICSVGGHDVDSSTGMRIPVDCDDADYGSFDPLLELGRASCREGVCQ